MVLKFDTAPKFMNLEEGAEYLGQAFGDKWTERHLLTMAENHQFGLFVGLEEKPPFISKTRFKHPAPSSKDGFYMFPLSTENIQELMAQGHTLITRIMVYGIGKDAGKETVGWEIDSSHQPPKVRLRDCRVSRVHLDRWIELNQLEAASNPIGIWSVRKPKRNRGYTAPLYQFLKDAQEAGKPVPTPHDVCQAWRKNKPPQICVVNADGFDYYLIDKTTKTANIKAIREAIRGLVSLS